MLRRVFLTGARYRAPLRTFTTAETDKESVQRPASRAESPEAQLDADKDKQIAQLQDMYRRSLADMENMRQRTRKEVEHTATFAIQKFAKDLLDTVDILTMAIESVPAQEVNEKMENTHLKTLHTGVNMTRTELLKTLKRHGVEPYSPKGEKFDPNMHQALYQAPVPGHEPGTVVEVEKIGYTLNGRVLRPAQVGVVSEGAK